MKRGSLFKRVRSRSLCAFSARVYRRLSYSTTAETSEEKLIRLTIENNFARTETRLVEKINLGMKSGFDNGFERIEKAMEKRMDKMEEGIEKRMDKMKEEYQKQVIRIVTWTFGSIALGTTIGGIFGFRPQFRIFKETQN